jgi:hypothetical protein
MFRTFALVAALLFTATSVSAQTIDAKGKCHDAKGKMAKMEVCKPAPAYGASTPKCKTGQLCGKTCIAKDKACHIK